MKNKKQKIFLICIGILLVVAAVLFYFSGDKKEELSTDYEEGEQEAIIYDGKKYEYNEHLSNFIFLGIDTREKVTTHETSGKAGQADAIFLVSLNRKEKTVKGLVIPRDTMTGIQLFAPDGTDLGSSIDHINIQYAFGDGKTKSCTLMKEAVSNLLYDLPIQGYFSMNMDGIPIAAKAAGGIEVIVPNNSMEGVNPEYKEGATITITETNAEEFVRYRDTNVSQSALGRSERQVAFLKAFFKKVGTSAKEDQKSVAKLLDSVEDYVVTNISSDMFLKLAEASYSEGDVKTIPGAGVQGEEFDEYHVDENQLYHMVLQMFYKEVQEK